MSEKQIIKIICELKYPHAELLFDKRGAIAKRWRGSNGLTDWRIAHNQVALHNKEQTIFFDVQLTQMVSIMEFPESGRTFSQISSELLYYTIELLGIRQITRIGLRVFQYQEKEDFQLLMKNIREKLCLIPDEDWHKLGTDVKDIGISYIIKMGDKLGHIILGPMVKEQLGSYLTSSDYQNKLPETCLFIDFDLYQSQPGHDIFSTRRRLQNFVSSGIDEVVSFTDRFIDFYGGFE